MPTLYADDGSIRATIVSGITPVGAYAANGSLNLIESTPSTYGLHHPCGAKYITLVTAAPTSPIPLYAANGSWNVTLSPLRVDGLPMITIVAGSLSTTTASGAVASFDARFINNRVSIGSTHTTPNLALTVSRASNGTYIEDNGYVTTFLPNTPRVGSRGLLVEPSRTNLVNNNTCAGAVAGSPGTLPTGWAFTLPAGVTRTISFDTYQGIERLNIRCTGTVSSAAINFDLAIAPSNSIPLVAGDILASSAWFSITRHDEASKLTTWNQEVWELTSAFGFISVGVPIALGFNIPWTRKLQLQQKAGATLAFVVPHFRQTATNNVGDYHDFTLSIGLPQLEKSLTEVNTATVSAGGAGYAPGDTITFTDGTFTTACVLTVDTVSVGVITGVTVTTRGSYSTSPVLTNNATFTTSGVGVGATFNLAMQVVGAASGVVNFETTPIKTTGAIATRLADGIRLIGTGFTSWWDNTQWSHFIEWEHLNQSSGATLGGVANNAAPSFNNNQYFFGNLTHSTSVLSAGLGQFANTAQTLLINPVVNKMSAAFQQDNFAVSYNGNGPITDGAGLLPAATMTRLVIGSAPWSVSSNMTNAYIKRWSMWNTRISDSDILGLVT